MLFTIGHSNHSLAEFLNLLKAHDIQVLVDVRSVPYSRYVPHFNKEYLEKALEQAGVGYVYMGNQLGGKPRNQKGKIDFNKLMQKDSFWQGIRRIEHGLKKGFRIALMCGEKDPLRCHRHHLLAKVFETKRNVPVYHILSNGRLTRAKELYAKGAKQPALFS